MCENFGWTIEYVKNMNLEDYDDFSAVLSGRRKGIENSQSDVPKPKK